MAKPTLPEQLQALERRLITSMLQEGLKRFRADSTYPQSHADMAACVRGMLGLGPWGTAKRCADLPGEVLAFEVALERFRRALQGMA